MEVITKRRLRNFNACEGTNDGGDEVVLSGCSGRFPESDNLQEFAENLFSGTDMITDDSSRWTPGLYGMPKRIGKIKELDRFDATFFAILPKHAESMDPQIRILLEVSYEAVFDAGVNPSSIRSSKTGVFVGTSWSGAAIPTKVEQVTGNNLWGNARTMFANRLSFTLDLLGPSIAIDTACSSGLTAVGEAFDAIRAGHCDAAIVGGSNILLNHIECLEFHRLNLLAPDGKCKSFDISGDGYARSEAVVVLYLLRRQQAIRAYGTILNVRSNANGFKANGITFPSGASQTKLMEEAYAEVDIDTSQVSYVEAHGTGTKAGDPEEFKAIASVFCSGAGRPNPLLIGSVKANMGHSEPVSGLCGLAKVILGIQTGGLPGQLHFNSPHPEIAQRLSTLPVRIVNENTEWGGGIVGVNSFGFGGSNCHLILRSNPRRNNQHLINSKSRQAAIPVIVPFSGRTEDSVLFALTQVASLGHKEEAVAMLYNIFRQSILSHGFRGFVVFDTLTGTSNDPVIKPVADMPGQSASRPLWFVLSGMGTQWNGCGAEFLKLRIFRKTIIQLGVHVKLVDDNVDLLDILSRSTETTFKNVLNSFLAIVGIQVGLVHVLESLGMRNPDGLIGFSVGEVTAAYVDGCFDAKEAILTAFARGRAILDCKLPLGAMIAVGGLSWNDVHTRCPANVFPACHNSLDNVSISGPAKSVQKFSNSLKSEGFLVKDIDSSGQAFHSKHLSAAGPRMLAIMRRVIHAGEGKLRTNRWKSTSIPEHDLCRGFGKKSSPEYHVNNLLSPVFFYEAVVHVPADALVIEIAPHCILGRLVDHTVSSEKCSVFGLSHKASDDNLSYFLNTLGKLFNAGLNFNFGHLYDIDRMQFPVSTGTPHLSPLVRWDHSITWGYECWPEREDNFGVSVKMTKDSAQFYSHHKVYGRAVFPAMGYLFLVWEKWANLKNLATNDCPVVFEAVSFDRAIFLDDAEGHIGFVINFFEGSGQFEVHEKGSVIVNGIVRSPNEKFEVFSSESDLMKTYGETRNTGGLFKYKELDQNDVYKELRVRGYGYTGPFQKILKADNELNWAKIAWESNWITFLDCILQFLVLDSTRSILHIPIRLQKLYIHPQTFLSNLDCSSDNETKSVVADGENATPSPAISVGNIVRHKYLDIVTAPGLEVRGLKTRVMPRRPNNEQTPLQRQSFELYYDTDALVLRDEKMRCIPVDGTRNLEDILCLFVTIVSENIDAARIKVVQLLDLPNSTNANLAKQTCDILISQVMKQFEFILIVTASNTSDVMKESVEASKLIEQLPETDHRIQILRKPDGDHLHPEPGTHLILMDSEELLLRTMTSPLVTNIDFILYTTKLDKTAPHFSNICATAYKLVAQKAAKDNIVYLYKNVHQYIKVDDNSSKVSFLTNDTIISVSRSNYDWISPLKSALQDALVNSSNIEQQKQGRIILFNKHERSSVAGGSASGILGFVKCLLLEPGGYLIRCFFEKTAASAHSSEYNFDNLSKEQLNSDLVINVHDQSKGGWGTYAHYKLGKQQTGGRRAVEHAFVDTSSTGDLATLGWIESPLKIFEQGYKDHHIMSTEDGGCSKKQSAPSEICRIKYAAVNFADIMLASGRLTADVFTGYSASNLRTGILGMEFSGYDSLGRRVVGVVPFGGLATSTILQPSWTWELTDRWTLAQGATIPNAYATALYALIIRGKLKSGESVLVHSGAGAVGQAALGICLRMNCTVYTTVGSVEKRNYLKSLYPGQLDDVSFSNSRDLSFEYHVMRETEGRGVDVVLNSLSGELLLASIRCVAKNGRFLEIGKADLAKNKPFGMSVLLNNVDVQGVQLHCIFKEDITHSELTNLMYDGFDSGLVQPLPYVVFGDDQVEEAFRYLASGKHIGKVLIRIGPDEELLPLHTTVIAVPRVYFKPGNFYLIAGGLGGLGLELADWMCHRGARKLVLVSRSGVLTGYQEYRLRHLKESKATVVTSKVDLTSRSATTTFLKECFKSLGVIDGIFNLACVLEDTLFKNQSGESFRRVSAPKVDITTALDDISRTLVPKMNHFVVFSSISSGYGNAGQTNYGYANSCMERICEKRVEDGFSGLAIQWGPVADVGMYFERSKEIIAFKSLKFQPQDLHSCWNALDQLLHQTSPVVSSVVALQRPYECVKESLSLSHSVARIFGMEDITNINKNLSLGEMGLDSLMATEVLNLMKRNHFVYMSVADVRLLTLNTLEELDRESKRRHTVGSPITGITK